MKFSVKVDQEFCKLHSSTPWGVKKFRRYLYPKSLMKFIGCEFVIQTKGSQTKSMKRVKSHVSKVVLNGVDLNFSEWTKIECSLEKSFIDMKSMVLFTNSSMLKREAERYMRTRDLKETFAPRIIGENDLLEKEIREKHKKLIARARKRKKPDLVDGS